MEEKNKVTDEVVLTRKTTIFSSAIDDDFVMMDDSSGHYFNMNATAKKIWELLETPKTYADLITALTNSYGIAYERCEKEVRPFIEKMLEFRLASIVEKA